MDYHDYILRRGQPMMRVQDRRADWYEHRAKLWAFHGQKRPLEVEEYRAGPFKRANLRFVHFMDRLFGGDPSYRYR